MKYTLNFYTSHCQFYIHDKNAEGGTGSENFWTNDSFDDRLAIETGILGVGTECYGPVKGEINMLSCSPPKVNLDEYDHIVEAGIEIKSGVLQILDCPTSTIQLEVLVPPGVYRARINSSNLASVTDDEGDDYYKIEIWPDIDKGRTVYKRYNRAGNS